MAADFPTTLVTIQRVLPGDRQDAPGKEGDLLHNQICDELEALQAKVGIDGSAVATSIDKRLADVETGGTSSAAHAAAAAPHSGHSTPASVSAAIASAISTNGLLGYLPATTIFKLSPLDTNGASLSTILLMTTADASWISRIGSATKPVGASGTNSDHAAASNSVRGTPWSDDSGYVVGAADISTIVGGYDHVNNQIAGTIIGGGHHYIQYDVNGHSTIVGGSNNRIQAGRAAIVGGQSCTVANGSTFSAIVGGEYNTCRGNKSFIGGGDQNTINNSAGWGAIVGGLQNEIAASVSYGAIVGGRSNLCSHDYASVHGRDGVSQALHGLIVSRIKLGVVGDNQVFIQPFGVRTTDAVLTNMSDNWVLPSGARAACSFTCRIVGMDEATGGVAIFYFSGGFAWDGAGTATLYNDAGASSTSALNCTQAVDTIGVAAVPTIACNGSAIRPKVTGKAATNIKWSAYLSGTITRM